MAKFLLPFVALLNLPFIAAADQQFTEAELRPHDGSDADKPIYLAINGTVFDVSASPAFYGPGGHYHHFTGRDATRAWVTECWDEPEQLTWRMDDVHEMFMARYMDESLELALAGEGLEDLGLEGIVSEETIKLLAGKAIQRLGKVSAEEKAARWTEDTKEAKQKVHDTLAHWIAFFANNDKYKVAGTVVYDEDKPAPPAICKEAMKKRPMKGGKLDGMMGDMGGMGGGSGAAGKQSPLGETVKETKEDDDELVRDEL